MCAHHSLKGCSALSIPGDKHMDISAPPDLHVGGQDSVRTSPGANIQGSNLCSDETSSTASKAQLTNLYYARSYVQLSVSSSVSLQSSDTPTYQSCIPAIPAPSLVRLFISSQTTKWEFFCPFCYSASSSCLGHQGTQG